MPLDLWWIWWTQWHDATDHKAAFKSECSRLNPNRVGQKKSSPTGTKALSTLKLPQITTSSSNWPCWKANQMSKISLTMLRKARRAACQKRRRLTTSKAGNQVDLIAKLPRRKKMIARRTSCWRSQRGWILSACGRFSPKSRQTNGYNFKRKLTRECKSWWRPSRASSTFYSKSRTKSSRGLQCSTKAKRMLRSLSNAICRTWAISCRMHRIRCSRAEIGWGGSFGQRFRWLMTELMLRRWSCRICLRQSTMLSHHKWSRVAAWESRKVDSSPRLNATLSWSRTSLEMALLLTRSTRWSKNCMNYKRQEVSCLTSASSRPTLATKKSEKGIPSSTSSMRSPRSKIISHSAFATKRFSTS